MADYEREVLALKMRVENEVKAHEATHAAYRKRREEDRALHVQELLAKDGEIAAIQRELDKLKEFSQLRANLYAFSDTFHLAAKRIVETEDPAEEARTLKILADQLLQVMGLPPRPADEFE